MGQSMREEQDDAYEAIKSQLQQCPTDKLTMLLNELNVSISEPSVSNHVHLSYEELEMLTQH
ncbi:TPA: hypothetical protein RQL08_002517 [Vibrio vulnificus]|nr:hypothetical protein [Vibrio vulnificus]HDY8136082.1 hypothetical protein [Vibrio vulnificus]HDY8148838.1 hypothetical protein [Vibrio vulnificus]HDY8154175.1 hypothetical protein [Vibrio vulnificus]